MLVIYRVCKWLNDRLQIAGPLKDTADHQVPRETASFFYVFGSAAAVVFALQVVTGVLLAFLYIPSAGEAWNSLQALNHSVPFGWYIRALHGWGSLFMVSIVLVHMVQVFLFGAYKFPRELTWMVGVFLLLMTLAMAFSGQVLRFDQDAFWGVAIGASIASRIPVIGAWSVHMLLGGPIIAASTLSRFFALHVFIVPGLLAAFVGIHVWMVLKLGINDWPMPGRLVRKATYEKQYQELLRKDSIPFFPDAAWKDVFFSGCVLVAIGLVAAFFGPFGPSGVPDPTIIQTVPRPDFFFLWIFALLALLPPSMEATVILLGPIIVILGLLALPLVYGEGEKSWRRRPVAVLIVLFVAVVFGVLTQLGARSPWSPVMSAWSANAIPKELLQHRTALERQGALVFQYKQCRNCHALGGVGGQRGPALDDVALVQTEDQLIRQVLQGGGNMPAFGKSLSPAQTTALVAFLKTLHPPGITPAQDASRGVTNTPKTVGHDRQY